MHLFHSLSITLASWAQFTSKLPAGFPWWLSSKECACSAGDARDLGSVLVRKIPWRRGWQPTPVILPGKFHGQISLVDYSVWGCKQSDMTEQHAHTYMYTLCWPKRSFGKPNMFAFKRECVMLSNCKPPSHSPLPHQNCL